MKFKVRFKIDNWQFSKKFDNLCDAHECAQVVSAKLETNKVYVSCKTARNYKQIEEWINGNLLIDSKEF